MKKDLKLEKLCKEFASLDAQEKDYILGISKSLDFSVQHHDLSPGNLVLPFQDQTEKPRGRKPL
jgi:hypothetical protein